MFAYCRNNPICRIDAYGMADATCVNQDGNNNWEPFDDAGRFGGGSLWSTFMGTLDALSSSFNMAAGGGKNHIGTQKHHIASNKHSKFTPQYQEIAERNNYSLDHETNIIELEGHQGRHTNKYHEFVLGALDAIDEVAKGSFDLFCEGMKILGEYIQENLWLLYAK